MYKLGKLPARKDAVKFKLRMYVEPTTVPEKYSHRTLIRNWKVLGNDQWGDCVLAGADHETMLWGKMAGTQIDFEDATALADYSAITGFNPGDPGTDQGTDMQAAATYRRKTGVVDVNGNRHQVGAYLAITPGSKSQLKQAIYYFGAVGIGFNFPDVAMDQFHQRKPWTVKNGNIEGGHYVPAVGYDKSYIYVVTWGRIQKMSWAFYKKYCDEAIAYVSKEMLVNGKSLEGFDYEQLVKSLGEL